MKEKYKKKKTVLNNIIFYNVSAGYENNRERETKKNIVTHTSVP